MLRIFFIKVQKLIWRRNSTNWTKTVSENTRNRGVATGVYGYLYPPPPKKKSAQVNFLWGKNDVTSERLFNSFIPPKNFYTPKKQISGYAPDPKRA